MLSVTSLRNVKKLLINFLNEKLNRKEKEIMDKIAKTCREAEDVIKTYYVELPNADVTVHPDGSVEIHVPPQEIKPLNKIIMLNEELDKIREETQEQINIVETYFTLAEASSILSIPEMPESIKEMIDELVENLK